MQSHFLFANLSGTSWFSRTCEGDGGSEKQRAVPIQREMANFGEVCISVLDLA